MKDKAIIELVVVLILVIFGFWALSKDSVVVNNKVAEVVPTEDVREGSVSTGVAAPITYAQALKTYKDARIQLNPDCQASPNNVTYKNNTSIMIDNRSDKKRTVKLGSSFTVPAYGFKIVRLSSATLPATWYVNCDNSKNVATILIQK